MNNKLLSFLLAGTLLSVSMYSCKTADPDPVAPAENMEYFPLEIGKYVTYNVDSTVWNDTACVVIKYSSQMMFTVADTFTDAQGRPSYRIDTRYRKYNTQDWMQHDVQYVTATDVNLEWVHSGQRFIKLVFPVGNGRTWKGNAYIQTKDPELKYFEDWDYRYTGAGESYNAGEVNYDNTVTIQQVDEAVSNPYTIPQTNAMRTYGKEVYAKGIGMVYREYYHWKYDANAQAGQSPLQGNKCLQGAGVVMRAVDHN